MTVYFLVFIILGLVVWLMIVSIESSRFEAALNATKDRLMSLMIGKKMLVKRNYLRKEELYFLSLLESTFGDKYIVKPQIHFSDFADIKSGYYDHDNLYYDLKRIILDYVIFDKQYNPLVGVELNGSSHFYNYRINRDKLTENLLHNIGVEYHEISLSKKYNASEIKAEIEKKIESVRHNLVAPQGVFDSIK